MTSSAAVLERLASSHRQGRRVQQSRIRTAGKAKQVSTAARPAGLRVHRLHQHDGIQNSSVLPNSFVILTRLERRNAHGSGQTAIEIRQVVYPIINTFKLVESGTTPKHIQRLTSLT